MGFWLATLGLAGLGGWLAVRWAKGERLWVFRESRLGAVALGPCWLGSLVVAGLALLAAGWRFGGEGSWGRFAATWSGTRPLVAIAAFALGLGQLGAVALGVAGWRSQAGRLACLLGVATVGLAVWWNLRQG